MCGVWCVLLVDVVVARVFALWFVCKNYVFVVSGVDLGAE